MTNSPPDASLAVAPDDLLLLLRLATLHAAMLGEPRFAELSMRLVDAWAGLSDEQNAAERQRTLKLGVKISTVLSEHR
jgi:hypothetical protein